MSITIKDIAKSAGVSYSTVSKALRDSPLVKDSTKQKIIAIAREIGYQPNVAARSLVSKKTDTIGIVWPTVERVAHSVLITEITARLEKMGYTTLVSINDKMAAVQTFNRFNVDAILLFDESNSANQVYSSSIPLISYGLAAEHPIYPTVDANRRKAIKLAVTHLLKLGHQKISFIGDVTGKDAIQQDKFIGFKQAMKDISPSGFNDSFIAVPELEQYDGYLAAKSLVAKKDRPTAIISSSYDLARGILRAVEESSLSIPEDISLISYDVIPHKEQLQFPVSTVGVPLDVIADTLTEVLVNRIEGIDLEYQIILEPQLNLTRSCQ